MISTPICLVISKNHLAYARTAINSFLRHNRQGKAYVLLIDEVEGCFRPQKERFEIIPLSALLKRNSHLRALAFRYDPLELACALKPFLLKHLLDERGLERVFFIDSDTYFTSSLDAVLEEMGEASIYLTPHSSRAMKGSSAGLIADHERQILQCGMFNGGFVGVRNTSTARDFLQWWSARVSHDCRIDQEHGVFLDQKWLDHVPLQFDEVKISRHLGVNVGYWRFHEHDVTSVGNSYRVGGDNAILWHFSGFQIKNPRMISRHLMTNPWLMPVKTRAAVWKLCEEYARRLSENGHASCSRWRYSLEYFDNGVKISPVVRRLYARVDPLGEYFKSPFEVRVEPSFYFWMVGSRSWSSGGKSVAPLILQMRGERADVVRNVPDPLGSDSDQLQDWAERDGFREFKVTPKIASAIKTLAKAKDGKEQELRAEREIRKRSQTGGGQSRSPVGFGVNLIGFLDSEKSYGVVSRSDLDCLSQAAIPFTANNIRDPNAAGSQELMNRFQNLRNPYFVNLIRLTPASLPLLTHHYPKCDLGEGRLNIVAWDWEFQYLREQDAAWLHLIDEFWVSSTFMQQGILPYCRIPAVVMPHPLKKSILEYTPGTFDFNAAGISVKPDDFVFLFCFDFHSYWERKNPAGLIRAFKRAFSKRDKAVLILKSVHGDYHLAELNFLKKLVRGERIHLIDRIMPEHELSALMNSCHAYVSLHRAEGFGLTMLESMAFGKPTIGTAYSGNLDFMSQVNSYLVPYKEVRLQQDYAGIYRKGDIWAEPDQEGASQALRAVFTDRKEAERRACLGRAEVRARFTPERIGNEYRQRLNLIERLHF